MKNEVVLSINQLADFINASDAKRLRIIEQQKKPNKFKVPYYVTAKAAMRTAIKYGDLEPIKNGLEALKKKVVSSRFQNCNKSVSIEALSRFSEMEIHKLLKGWDYEVINRPSKKSVIINDVELLVSPDIVVVVYKDGKKYLGGVKLHISKSNIFDYSQQSCIAIVMKKYLEELALDEDDVIVSSEFCFSLDLFGGKLVSAPEDISLRIGKIEEYCEYVKYYWLIAS